MSYLIDIGGCSNAERAPERETIRSDDTQEGQAAIPSVTWAEPVRVSIDSLITKVTKGHQGNQIFRSSSLHRFVGSDTPWSVEQCNNPSDGGDSEADRLRKIGLWNPLRRW